MPKKRRDKPTAQPDFKILRAHIANRPLPAAAIDALILDDVVALLAKAWRKVIDGEERPSRDEDRQTCLLAAALDEIIYDEAESDLLKRCGVISISREGSQISHDGNSIAKSPDLSLRLDHGLRPFFPLIVECKVIGGGRQTIREYWRYGIQRFIQGTYAWQTGEAMMIAYVADSSSTLSLGRAFDAGLHGCAASAGHRPLPHPEVDRYASAHDRSFSYPTQPTQSPGSIVLWHLWLGLPPAAPSTGSSP